MADSHTPKPFHNEIILKVLLNRRYRLFRHLALILLLAAALYNSEVEFSEPVSTYAKIWLFSMLLSLFYINMYWLVPKLLFKDNYLAYFLWIFGIFIIIQILFFNLRQIVIIYVKPINRSPHEEPNLFAFSFIFMILFGASAAVKLFQRWIVDSQRINELEKTTVRSELEHLKNQINPHFLFNMLNNANVLTQIDPVRASEVLIKLSDLLRYQLYDSSQNKVFLTSEIQFLEDFLNLEKIRRDYFEFAITKDGLFLGLKIAPLLFITFVENAIKHNIDAEEPSFVNLFFTYTEERIYFKCINSKPRITVSRRANGGLGLTNITRRLQLLYPGNHKLNVINNLDTFNVDLMIKI